MASNIAAAAQTFNLNAAECLHKATHIGMTRVHNVCAGTTYDVPWGAGDWLLAIGATLFVLACVATFSSIAFLMWRD